MGNLCVITQWLSQEQTTRCHQDWVAAQLSRHDQRKQEVRQVPQFVMTLIHCIDNQRKKKKTRSNQIRHGAKPLCNNQVPQYIWEPVPHTMNRKPRQSSPFHSTFSMHGPDTKHWPYADKTRLKQPKWYSLHSFLIIIEKIINTEQIWGGNFRWQFNLVTFLI